MNVMDPAAASDSLSSLGDLATYVSTLQPLPRVVSLDVFDTCLWRIVSPGQVARLATQMLCQKMAESGAEQLCVDAILEDRIAFVRRCESKARAAGCEWSIREWYEHLAGGFSEHATSVVELGLDCELAAEILCTRAAPGARVAIQQLRCDGLQVVATSDTQLPHDLLAALLDAHNLSFDAIYSSAAEGCSKRWGDMFPHLLEQTGVRARDLLHVGDHWKSDAVRAAGCRCRFVWLPRSPKSPLPKISLRWTLGTSTKRRVREILCALDVPTVDSSRHPLYRLAFQWVARVLAISSLWQWQYFRRLGIEDALFLARDGKAFLEAYNLLASALPNSPRRHYVCLSRRAVSLAHPGDLLQQTSSVVGKSPRETVGDFLAQFALSQELEQCLLITANLSHEDLLGTLTTKRLRRAVKIHRPAIDAAQRDQRALIRRYLGQFVNPGSARLALVDVGWAGTIQDALGAVLDDVDLVAGLYLGVSNDGHSPQAASLKHGLLRDDYSSFLAANPLEKTAGVIRLWELLLSSDEPPTKALDESTDGTVRPVFGKPISRSSRQKQSLMEMRKGLRDGVRVRVDAVRALARIGRGWDVDVWRSAASIGARRITCLPSAEEARCLLDLDYEDNVTHETRVSLDLDGLLTGTSWYSGVAAKYGLNVLQRPLELAASMALR